MLAQAYRWTLDDIKKLSYLQILLIQHAASYNRKLLDKRLEQRRAKDEMSPTDELTQLGKPFSELTSDEVMLLAGGEHGGRVKRIATKKAPTDGQPEQED